MSIYCYTWTPKNNARQTIILLMPHLQEITKLLLTTALDDIVYPQLLHITLPTPQQSIPLQHVLYSCQSTY